MAETNSIQKVNLSSLYKNKTEIRSQEQRFAKLTDLFNQTFAAQELFYFSSPGRIEIAGNHTDHNNGLILAAAINIDSIAVVSQNEENKINLYSVDMNQLYSVELDELEKKPDERGKTSGLIRGIAAMFSVQGYKIGGFNCVVESSIGIGSGLSSSASIEVLIGTILNDLFNDNRITPVEIAKFGQTAENKYFDKPCGLMDQLAIAEGGIVAVDFKDKNYPGVEKLPADFSDYGFSLVIVNTGGTHANLTDDYASIPMEMKAVAAFFHESSCRSLSREQIMEHLDELRNTCGDRALLRALHFLSENERVEEQVNNLSNNRFDLFLQLIRESGNSSARWLQNIYSIKDPRHQSISLALEITEQFFRENGSRGACRVHGGGFAGTILVFVEDAKLKNYVALMEKLFGQDAAKIISIRNYGTCRLNI